LIGQLFNTYWLVEFQTSLYIIDQHAAHEKVLYERLMKQYREREILTQNLLPPLVVTLTGQEQATFLEYQTVFESFGFEVEPFGENDYALRCVPIQLYQSTAQEVFLEILDSLSESGASRMESIEARIASMACKAAIKGNHLYHTAEAQALLDELFVLEDPYHCPHGRPVILSMSREEVEKKFKRIV
jgi:DNA mismatch repair protein MutL